jgi:3-oxoacyl-[acyl-carrier protein] reductase
VHVPLTARGAEALKKTADEIRKANPSITVTEIVGDITTPAGREAVHPDGYSLEFVYKSWQH